MDLSKLQNLATEDKLLWLRCSVGLQQLEEWLSENSLRKIAHMMGIDPKTIYRWCKYPDIAEVVAPYAPIKSPKVDPIDLSRDATYRIICAYEDHKTYLKGAIYGEYHSPENLWNSKFIQGYFNTFGVWGSEYRTQYSEAINRKGTYFISNYICATYCKVSAKGKIIPLVPST